MLVVVLTGCTAEPSTQQQTNNYGTDTPLQSNTTLTLPATTPPVVDPAVTDNTMTDDQEKNFTQATIKTTMGDITVEFYPESPKTVENFTTLVSKGFYNGIKFHRVISNFMIQSGDPNTVTGAENTWGMGGPGYKFADEFNDRKLVKGSLAMANSGPNTNGSQFFIVTADSTPWLDGKHTNFGHVIKGLDIVEKIGATKTLPGDRPATPISIVSVELK